MAVSLKVVPQAPQGRKAEPTVILVYPVAPTSLPTSFVSEA